MVILQHTSQVNQKYIKSLKAAGGTYLSCPPLITPSWHHHSCPVTQIYQHTCQYFSSSFPSHTPLPVTPPSSAACLHTPYLSIPCTYLLCVSCNNYIYMTIMFMQIANLSLRSVSCLHMKLLFMGKDLCRRYSVPSLTPSCSHSDTCPCVTGWSGSQCDEGMSNIYLLLYSWIVYLSVR